MHVVHLIHWFIIDVDFRFVRHDISLRNILQMFKQHSVYSFILSDSAYDFFFGEAEYFSIVIPGLGFQTLLDGLPIVFVYSFAVGYFVVIVAVFSEHVRLLAVDQTICKQQLPLLGVNHFWEQIVLICYFLDHIDLLQPDRV